MRSLAAKLFLTFSVALLAFALVAVFAVGRMHALGTDLRLISEGYLPLTRIAAQVEVKDWVTSRVLEAHAMDPAARRAYLPLARAHFPAVVKEKLGEARAVLAGARRIASGADVAFLADVTARVDSLDARWTAYAAAAGELFDALERSTGDERAVAERVEAARRLERGLSLDVKLLQAALEGQVADRVHAAQRAERRGTVLIVVLFLLAAVVGFASTLLARRLLAPIRTLTEEVKAVAAGDLSRKAEVHSGDELGVLAREFNAMAESLERQRAALLRAERLATVGRISAHITHEVRNPLNAIGLNAELLAEEAARLHVGAGAREAGTAEEIRALAEAIGREVDRLNAVTEEYLRFARLPRTALAREDLNGLVTSVVDFSRGELAGAGVEVRLDLAADLPPVLADESQLRAVLLNLLRNAREAMAAGGTLSVNTRPCGGGQVEVEVRDTGPGVPPEDLPRIFEPFYSTKEGGTGLGLAFAQQVVQEHGGTIACTSVRGVGASFTFSLPAAAEVPAPTVNKAFGEALEA